MVYKIKLKVRDEERWLTSIEYGYRIKFSDVADIDKIIQLHQEVSAKLGSEEPLPLEGGLFRLRFSSTDHDQFFYDWMFVSAMEDGSIEILQNEVETVSRISFWDCYCVGIEEWMSVGGAPMGIELLLSPAIVKKDALVYEKIWKVSDIHGNTEEVKGTEEDGDKKKIVKITDAYWIDDNGQQIRELNLDHPVTLYVVTDNFTVGKTVNLRFEDKDQDGWKVAECSGDIDSNGIIVLENFKLEIVKDESNGNNDN